MSERLLFAGVEIRGAVQPLLVFPSVRAPLPSISDLLRDPKTRNGSGAALPANVLGAELFVSRPIIGSRRMANEWFYGPDKARSGPFSAKQIRELKVQGRLLPTDMVWKAGVKNGKLASEIRGLFSEVIAGPTIPVVVIQTLPGSPVSFPVLEETVALPLASLLPVALNVPVHLVIVDNSDLVPIDEHQEAAERASSAVFLQTHPEAPVRLVVHDVSDLVAIPEDQVFADRIANEILAFKNPVISNTGLANSPAEIATAPVVERPRRVEPPVRVKRATADSGVIIISQDGERVRFRKKCTRCGCEDSCNSVLRMMPGINRQMWFCPKCRKQVSISIRVI